MGVDCRTIVNRTKKYSGIVIKIVNNPLTDSWEVLFFESFEEVIRLYIRKTCEDP